MFNCLVPYFIDRINEFPEKDLILVFKNFPLDFIKKISDHYPLLYADLKHISKSKINITSLAKNKKKLLKILLSQEIKSPVVLLYEELLLLSQSLSDLSMLENKIIIFDNNLYSEIPNNTTVIFPDLDMIIDSNKLDFSEEKVFSDFYSSSVQFGSRNIIQVKNIDTNGVSNVQKYDLFDIVSISPLDLFTQQTLNCDHDTSIDIYSLNEYDYLEFKYSLFENDINQASNKVLLRIDPFLLKQNVALTELKFIRFLCEKNGKNICFKEKQKEVNKRSRSEFNSILSKHWGSSEFRQLKFYKNPDEGKTSESVSQENIIEEIVTQVENVKKEIKYNDIFITAPTGSGKSLLYQIPALYLHEKYKYVTIIISPLIALMFDQIAALKEKGITSAEAINSNVNYFQRQQILRNLQKGDVSILYLSPELLLSYGDIRYFLGERELGLMVIDEAHLVTTWGRDFRIDYWYLGNYLRKLRKFYDLKFSVLSLTATAVYGGMDDVVYETISALNMKFPKFYIGNIKRENIAFSIHDLQIKGNHESGKVHKTSSRISEYITNHEKAIAYFPWKRQIQEVQAGLDRQTIRQTEAFLSDIPSEMKKIVIEKFIKGETKVVLATKAFGMGVDVPDIQKVYHHAPSGSLADYIQEVGRVARDPKIKGTAEIDFCLKDLKFMGILLGLSRLKQYQLKMVLQKLYKIFQNNGEKLNFLTTPEDFGFIFDNSDLENRVKSALLLIEKDLIQKYGYNVIIVRPRNIFSEVFCCIDHKHEDSFILQFGEYSRKISSNQENSRTDKDYSDVKDCGDIFCLKLDKIWEKFYKKQTFPEVKRAFFMGELFLFDDKRNHVYPRLLMEIELNDKKEKTKANLDRYLNVMYEVMTSFGGSYFKAYDAQVKFREAGFNEMLSRKITNAFSTVFSYDDQFTSHLLNPTNSKPIRQYGDTFLYKKNDEDGKEIFRLSDEARFFKFMRQSFKNFEILFPGESNKFEKYVAITNTEIDYRFKMAYLLEALDLGFFSICGGRFPQIFIRINDPHKIKILGQDKKYSNLLLEEISERHKRSTELLRYFFTNKMDDSKRWELVEDYFLGKEVKT